MFANFPKWLHFLLRFGTILRTNIDKPTNRIIYIVFGEDTVGDAIAQKFFRNSLEEALCKDWSISVVDVKPEILH